MNRIDTREDKYEIAKIISIDKGIDLIIEQAENMMASLLEISLLI